MMGAQTAANGSSASSPTVPLSIVAGAAGGAFLLFLLGLLLLLALRRRRQRKSPKLPVQRNPAWHAGAPGAINCANPMRAGLQGAGGSAAGRGGSATAGQRQHQHQLAPTPRPVVAAPLNPIYAAAAGRDMKKALSTRVSYAPAAQQPRGAVSPVKVRSEAQSVRRPQLLSVSSTPRQSPTISPPTRTERGPSDMSYTVSPLMLRRIASAPSDMSALDLSGQGGVALAPDAAAAGVPMTAGPIRRSGSYGVAATPRVAMSPRGSTGDHSATQFSPKRPAVLSRVQSGVAIASFNAMRRLSRSSRANSPSVPDSSSRRPSALPDQVKTYTTSPLVSARASTGATGTGSPGASQRDTMTPPPLSLGEGGAEAAFLSNPLHSSRQGRRGGMSPGSGAVRARSAVRSPAAAFTIAAPAATGPGGGEFGSSSDSGFSACNPMRRAQAAGDHAAAAAGAAESVASSAEQGVPLRSRPTSNSARTALGSPAASRRR
jgi:hypothetical protein